MRRAALNELREMVLWHTRIRLHGNFLHGLRATQGPSKGEKFTLKRPNHLFVLASEAWAGEGYSLFLESLGLPPDVVGSADATKEVLRPTFDSEKPWRRRAWEREASSVARWWLIKRVRKEIRKEVNSRKAAPGCPVTEVSESEALTEIEDMLVHTDVERMSHSTLPPLQAAIVWRRFLGYQIREIARDLGKSEGTITRSLHEARKNKRFTEELKRWSGG